MVRLGPSLPGIAFFKHQIRQYRVKSHYSAARKYFAQKDRDGVVRHALLVDANADCIDDQVQLGELCLMLQRLGEYETAWMLRQHIERLRDPRCFAVPVWDGGDLTSRTIVIQPNTYVNRIGTDIRFGRFFDPLVRRAKQCIVFAEPRMAPLLQRTFPSAEFRTWNDTIDSALAKADVVSSYGTLAMHLANSAGAIANGFVRLRPDPEITSLFREQYRADSAMPLIGVSWWSMRTNRDLPSLDHWAPILSSMSARFVSLQYKPTAADLATMDRITKGRFIYDQAVDQFASLDQFAAQIAALDAVVSITNTTIDMAASLGVPTIQIRDDNSYGIWPLDGPSPWYPDLVAVRKNGRSWPVVMAEVRDRLQAMLADRKNFAGERHGDRKAAF